jgi:hypothetical protein
MLSVRLIKHEAVARCGSYEVRRWQGVQIFLPG